MTIQSDHPTLEAARALQSELASRAAEMEDVRRHPADLAAKLAEGGVFKMILPSASCIR